MSVPQDKSLRITCGFYGLYELYAWSSPRLEAANYLKREVSHTLITLSGNSYLRCLRPRFAVLYMFNSWFVGGLSHADSYRMRFYTLFDATSS
jgi:hypothetical protein